MTHQEPLFPADMDVLAPHGALEVLDSAAVGAFYRVVRWAWRQDPPCSIPDPSTDAASLAMVARVTLEEWEHLAARLPLALSPSPPAGGSPGGRRVLTHVRGVYDSLASAAAGVRTQKSAAAKARWSKSPPAPPASTDAGAMHVHSSRIAGAPADAPTAPTGIARAPVFSSPSAPAPSLSQSADQCAQRDVIGLVGERARAIEHQKLAEWRRSKSLDLLQTAIVRWRKDGHTNYPIEKASELAGAAAAEPARVEALIEKADGELKNQRATPTTKAGRKCNPIGILITGLGVASYPTRPMEIPLFAANRWAGLEAEAMKTIRAQAAVLNSIARRAQGGQQSSGMSSGGAS